MRNITITVQNETYRQIRIWCAQHNTCISHVVQALLNDLPNRKDLQSVAVSATPGALPGHPSRFEEIACIMHELEQFGMDPLARRSANSPRRAV
jgi:hypothetical protein